MREIKEWAKSTFLFKSSNIKAVFSIPAQRTSLSFPAVQRVVFVAYKPRLSICLAVLVLSLGLLRFPLLIGGSATQQPEILTVHPCVGFPRVHLVTN